MPASRALGVGEAASRDPDRPRDLVVAIALGATGAGQLVPTPPEDKQGVGHDVLRGVGVDAPARVGEHRRPRAAYDDVEGLTLRRHAHTHHCPAARGILHGPRVVSLSVRSSAL